MCNFDAIVSIAGKNEQCQPWQSSSKALGFGTPLSAPTTGCAQPVYLAAVQPRNRNPLRYLTEQGKARKESSTAGMGWCSGGGREEVGGRVAAWPRSPGKSLLFLPGRSKLGGFGQVKKFWLHHTMTQWPGRSCWESTFQHPPI